MTAASKASGLPPLPSKTCLPAAAVAYVFSIVSIGKGLKIMNRLLNCAVIALGLAGAPYAVATPANAANLVGVHVGPVGLGFSVGNGHYYDHHHRRQEY